MSSPSTSVPALADAFTFTNTSAGFTTTGPTAALWGVVDEYQHLIERQLERHLTGRDPAAWPTLLDAMDTLEGWHEHSRDEVRRLVYETPDSYTAPVASVQYRQTNISGAIAEARVQYCLGTVTRSEYDAIQRCLEPMLEHREPPQGYLFNRLLLADQENREPWDGVLVLDATHLLASQPAPSRLLMYRFGVAGGWSAHGSSEMLLKAAAVALGALPAQQITLVAAPASAFTDALDQRVATLAAVAGTSAPGRDARERMLLEALDELTVPVNPARLLALARVEETRRSLHLGEQAQGWLSHMPHQTRNRLASLITDYVAAIGTSDTLLRRDLPARETYAATQVKEQLATSFGLTEPCRVTLKLPARVTFVKEPIAGSGAPGVPSKRVPRLSSETQLLSLETLAVSQIDEDLETRLAFLEVQVSPPDHPQRDVLKAGIDALWLRRVLPELDVAGKYERLLADVHLRAGQFNDRPHEQDVLARPFALMLEMHWIIAAQQGRLDPRGVAMAEQACHANTAQAWQAGGMNLSLRPAALTVFDEATHSSGSTLAGVTFIHDSISGTTLLYLPQAPDGQAFSQYPTLSAATEALADLFVNERMRRYLCDRALEGEPRRLENYVDQALIRGYRNLVGARAPWPSHQSLTLNQYLAELGLTVGAHRASSTSKADRLFDEVSRSRGNAVNYIRLTFGFIPFFGTAIALVDALEASIEAANAFASGDSIHGLEATESVLLSIVDALFDVGPAAAASASASASLMATARARQLRQGPAGAGRLRKLSGWTARRADEAFNGYERPVRLTTEAGTEGRWRNVYREPEGTFITRGSTIYAVEWDESLHTWRLAATRTRSYRQPVALDEAGHWQTHGQLYGSLVEGGLRGGGGVQSYIADRLDPLWPDALRRMLPRWWTDAHFRRQQQLLSERAARQSAVVDRQDALHEAINAYKRGEASYERVLDASDETVRAAEVFYQTEVDLQALSRGRRAAAAGADQSRAAATICSKTQLQIKVCFVESQRLMERALKQRDAFLRLSANLDAVVRPDNAIVKRLASEAKNIRATLNEVLKHYDRIDRYLERLRVWERRITSADHRRVLHTGGEAISRAFAKEPVTVLRLALLTDLACVDDLALPSWPYMRRLYGPARERFERVSHASFSGNALNLRPQQRQRLKTQLRDQAKAFIRVIQRLLASYPEQMDPVIADRLLAELRKLHDDLPIERIESTTTSGRSTARVFEGDGLLLVGEPVPGEPEVLVIPNVNKRPERWTRSGQTWVQADPAPATPPGPLGQLASHAQHRLGELPALRTRLKRYANQGMLPADLEDLYLGESQELQYRVRQLREAGADHRHADLIERLEREAEQLKQDGRQARIEYSKASLNPTGGQLDFLVEAGEARIRKVGGLQASGTTRATRNWLQEYEVLDSHTGRPLCYAHFHYRTENPRFRDYSAAHLKTPAQRFQATAGPGEPVIWRGEISANLATKLFEPLFR